MTKTLFLAQYRAHLLAMFPWAQDAAKLARFMESVETTISTDRATWNHDGEAVNAAWKDIGGKGKASLKALRALPA